MIDHHRARILRMLAERPRHINAFTDGSVTLQVAARHVERWLLEMVDGGWVLHTKADEYRITEAGRAALREQPAIAGKREHHGTGTYTGERWVIRDGGNQHEQFKSLRFGGPSISPVEES